MKIFLPVLMVLVAGCYGYPRHFNFNTFDVFVPCSDANALQTLWPDFNNNRIFHQCISVGHWGTHNCPANLLFSFWEQVCVWDFQWRAPPAPDQITPFPTTQWPRETTLSQQTTEEQELTVSPDDTTTQEFTTEEQSTITIEDDTTTTSFGDLTTLQEITLPADPELTPPTADPTTNLTPPTAAPTQPGDPTLPADPDLTPPGPITTTVDTNLTPPTGAPTDDPEAPIFTSA